MEMRVSSVCRSAVVALAILTCVGTTAKGQTGRKVAQVALRSVVLLVTEDANGQPRSIASGFFVRESVIATNAHAIEGAASGYVKIVGRQERHSVVGMVGLDLAHDLALLSIEAKSDDNLAWAITDQLLSEMKYSRSVIQGGLRVRYRKESLAESGV